MRRAGSNTWSFMIYLAFIWLEMNRFLIKNKSIALNTVAC